MPPQQIITFIIGTVVVLFGAYYVTYYIGMKASGQTRAGLRNRNISVHDRFSISRDKGFYIVEIAGKVYIVGVTTNNMTVLDTYDAKEFAELTATDNQNAAVSWSDTPVGRYGNKMTKKVVAFVAAKTGKLPKEQAAGDRSEENTAANDNSDNAAANAEETADETAETAPEATREDTAAKNTFEESMEEAQRKQDR